MDVQSAKREALAIMEARAKEGGGMFSPIGVSAMWAVGFLGSVLELTIKIVGDSTAGIRFMNPAMATLILAFLTGAGVEKSVDDGGFVVSVVDRDPRVVGVIGALFAGYGTEERIGTIAQAGMDAFKKALDQPPGG